MLRNRVGQAAYDIGDRDTWEAEEVHRQYEKYNAPVPMRPAHTACPYNPVEKICSNGISFLPFILLWALQTQEAGFVGTFSTMIVQVHTIDNLRNTGDAGNGTL